MFCTSCKGDNNIEFPVSAFPEKEEVFKVEPVKTHIYIQSSEDMKLLLGTDYDRAMGQLLGAGSALWHKNHNEQQLYRFDVLWLEDKREIKEFAYPLDPYWWSPEGMRNQGVQIYEPAFYSLSWYAEQHRRSPEVYADRNTGIPSPWSDEEQRLISRTIEEITTHRNGEDGERDISIMVTNFSGHHSESETIRTHILNYLNKNEQRAISTFVFENSGKPFYFLILGSMREVVDFSNQLKSQLDTATIKFLFGFFSNSETIISDISNNNNIIFYVEPSKRLETVYGVREAFFNEDLAPTEQNLFRSYMGEHHLLFTIYQKLINGNNAPINFDVKIDFPPLLRSRLSKFKEDTSLKLIEDKKMVQLTRSGTTVNIKEDNLCDGIIGLQINLDTSIFENIEEKALLIVKIYAELNVGFGQHELSMIKNQQFTDIFGQLTRNVSSNSGLAKHQIAELYIHLIYRK